MRARSAASSGRAVRTFSASSFMAISVGQSARSGKSHLAASQKNYGLIFQPGKARREICSAARTSAQKRLFLDTSSVVAARPAELTSKKLSPKAAFPEREQGIW